MRVLVRVPLAVSKNIKTAKDINDFFAYEERWGDDIEYEFETFEEIERMNKLIDEMNYVQGVYDIANVKRIYTIQ